MIKTKNFEQAIDLLKGKEKQFGFQHAYVLHRLGRNKEALKAIESVGDTDRAEVKHLIAQIVRSITNIFANLTYIIL